MLNSCAILKNSRDKSITNYLKKHPEVVRESAIFSVSAAINQDIRKFGIKDITDKAMRGKISSLGTMVYVSLKEPGRSYEIPDSNVTFQTITLLGVTEVIYDFAAGDRQFKNDISNKMEYYFIKVADRIYYRRRPFPMM